MGVKFCAVEIEEKLLTSDLIISLMVQRQCQSKISINRLNEEQQAYFNIIANSV